MRARCYTVSCFDSLKVLYTSFCRLHTAYRDYLSVKSELESGVSSELLGSYTADYVDTQIKEELKLYQHYLLQRVLCSKELRRRYLLVKAGSRRSVMESIQCALCSYEEELLPASCRIGLHTLTKLPTCVDVNGVKLCYTLDFKDAKLHIVQVTPETYFELFRVRVQSPVIMLVTDAVNYDFVHKFTEFSGKLGQQRSRRIGSPAEPSMVDITVR